MFGYLDDGILIYVARALRLPPSMVYGVATFYQLFTFDPPGEHTCTVCTGTACFVKGADDIVAAVAAAYEVPAGETTEDGMLTLKTARCLGSCGLAPVVLLDGEVKGREGVELLFRPFLGHGDEQVVFFFERNPGEKSFLEHRIDYPCRGSREGKRKLVEERLIEERNAEAFGNEFRAKVVSLAVIVSRRLRQT